MMSRTRISGALALALLLPGMGLAQEVRPCAPDFDKHGSSYDPARGLTITLPVLPPGSGEEASYLKITVNQATGQIQTQASHHP